MQQTIVYSSLRKVSRRKRLLCNWIVIIEQLLQLQNQITIAIIVVKKTIIITIVIVYNYTSYNSPKLWCRQHR